MGFARRVHVLAGGAAAEPAGGESRALGREQSDDQAALPDSLLPALGPPCHISFPRTGSRPASAPCSSRARLPTRPDGVVLNAAAGRDRGDPLAFLWQKKWILVAVAVVLVAVVALIVGLSVSK